MESSLFFGNGLNLLTANQLNWENLLKELANIANVSASLLSHKPYTMVYEEIMLNGNIDESILKNHVSKIVSSFKNNIIYEKICALELSNYITSNYDLTLERTFENLNFLTENDQPETIYSIRSGLKIMNANKEFESKIWHIHGEINRPNSISLGLDQYCGAIGKIDSYIKGTYTYTKDKQDIKTKSIKQKLKNEVSFDGVSWIELFFNSDVHIIGFGLDYSETDIWWILNRRAREKNVQNSIYYYGEIDLDKIQLLTAFNVNYIEVKRDKRLTDEGWSKQYDDMLIKIKDYINKSTN